MTRAFSDNLRNSGHLRREWLVPCPHPTQFLPALDEAFDAAADDDDDDEAPPPPPPAPNRGVVNTLAPRVGFEGVGVSGLDVEVEDLDAEFWL